MTKALIFCSFVSIIICFSGCATMTSSPEPQNVKISTEPAGAYVDVFNFREKEIASSGITPFEAQFAKVSDWKKGLYNLNYYTHGDGLYEGRRAIAYELYITKPGYVNEVVPIYAESHKAAIAGNAVVGAFLLPAGLLFSAIDTTNGSGVDVGNNTVLIKLYPDTIDGRKNRLIERNIAKCRKFRNDPNAIIYYTTEIITNVPDHYESRVLRANAHIYKGKTAPALDDINFILKANANDSEGLKLRGIVNRINGNIQQSLKDYAMALQISPNQPQIYFERAKTYYKNSQSSAAFGDLRKACELGLEQACDYKF
ncbi:M48 family metallopeptidase [Geobacter sp. SVR]|uniref:tetratricopeptide repeat protein n=1 Tax=Geobacter sp. SVR TaxID=2495594 RepID=UPI00143EF603|nr:tetratricopeptide repeat protein [Geobacter sp. SVR]BCS55727.1 hypothetical protein GSVR_40350 [Geobacter sp. SVR]GCF83731.1 hypothetical protein GSbR_03310 [Geobacter sp. SVR]